MIPKCTYTYSRSMPIQFSIVHISIWVHLHLHRQMEIDKCIITQTYYAYTDTYVNATYIEFLVLFHLMPAFQCDISTPIQRGQTDPVWCLNWTPSGPYFVSSGKDSVWRAKGPVVQDGLELQKVPGWYSNSKIFWNFSSRKFGKMIQFDLRMLFRWISSTTN